MDVNKTSGIYHKTTIDAARATRTTISRVGQKRTYDESNGGDTLERTSRSPILADITNLGGFQRPTLQPKCFDVLKASDIQDVAFLGPSKYSQRRGIASTLTPSSNPLLDLSHPAYGLPAQLVYNLANHGVKSIYPWQSECLCKQIPGAPLPYLAAFRMSQKS